MEHVTVDDDFGSHFVSNLSVAEDLAADGWNVFIDGSEIVAAKDEMNVSIEIAQHDRDTEEQLAEFLRGKDTQLVGQVTRGCLDYTLEERREFYNTFGLEADE